MKEEYEQKVNDALFAFSSDASNMWDKMYAGDWSAANAFADSLLEDIDEKREIASVLSDWDADDDNKIDVSEIDEDSNYAAIANIFAGKTTTFSIEDFQRFNEMLDLNEDGKVSNTARAQFGTLVADIKAGKIVIITDDENENII